MMRGERRRCTSLRRSPAKPRIGSSSVRDSSNSSASARMRSIVSSAPCLTGSFFTTSRA